MKFINNPPLALVISFLAVGFAVGSPTESHVHEALQGQQQQLNATGAKEVGKEPANKARYLGGVGGYEAPVISSGYETPIIQPYIQQQGYQQPTQSYGVPVQSYGSSYQQPIVQQSYGVQQQTYQQPIVSSYQQPIVSSYQQPIVSSYQQPIVSSYEQPIQQTYQQPIVSSYQQPIVSSYSNYSTPITSSYGGSSYGVQQQSYQQPIVQQSYQQPIVSNYTSSYQQPIVQQSYGVQQQSYQQPIVQQSYQQPIVSNYTSSYQQPIVQQSYQQPIVQQSYQQSYQQPIVSNYSTPIYTQQVSTYQQPIQSYETPVVSSYGSSYQQPIVEQAYVAPVQQSYGVQQQSYQQPIVQQSYGVQQPIVQQSYGVQQQSYQQPIVQQSYGVQQQSYQQPIVSSYGQGSYSKRQLSNLTRADVVNSTELSSIESLSGPTNVSLSSTGAASNTSSSSSSSAVTDVVTFNDDDMSTSDSVQSLNYVSRPQVINNVASTTTSPASYISQRRQQQIIQIPTSFNNIQSTSRYLDIQPEFTQSWADFYQPPGYLPLVFRNDYNLLLTKQPINYQTNINNRYPTTGAVGYNDGIGGGVILNGGAVNLQAIGLGYITTYGPINPAIFYVPVKAQYYYRVPIPSPYYILRQGVYLANQISQYIPRSSSGQQVLASKLSYKGGYGGQVSGGYGGQVSGGYGGQVSGGYGGQVGGGYGGQLTGSYGGQLSSGYGGQGVGVGVVKRSMNSHESAGAPYSMLVDHLAAAATESFTNVSSIECPPKPTSYTCPKMLNLNKEELKKKLCDYENVLTGIVNFVPDTEKAQTHCGAMKIIKSDGKNAVADLPEKMAIVLGKDCQMKTIFDAQQQQAVKDQVFILTKTEIPAGTKYILADGTNVDMLSAQSIPKEEISAILKQCPAKKSQ